MDQSKVEILLKQLDPKHTKKDALLSEYTPLKIGGPADVLYEAQTVDELTNVVKLARMMEVPVTVLGRATNVLISDDGIRGLVIFNHASNIKIEGEKPVSEGKVEITARLESDSTKGTFRGIEFEDLNYDESDSTRIQVTFDSGVDLPFALKYMLEKGITGLQWYAGIPGTIGGAVFNNIHGGTHFISEILSSVKVLTQELEVKELSIKDLGVDYDKSRFHVSSEVILQATFDLFKGNVDRARTTAVEWAKRKKVQPRSTPGCVFANITQTQKAELGYPTTSIGYIIEHVLGMSGFCIGDACIYEDHHNFIVNKGKATAKDYLGVIKEMHKRTKDKVGIELVPEIILLGFKKGEIRKLTTSKQDELRKVRNKEIKEVYNK